MRRNGTRSRQAHVPSHPGSQHVDLAAWRERVEAVLDQPVHPEQASKRDLKMALDNSRLNQTYNTPALATLFLLNDQIQWMLKNGGLSWAAKRSQKSSNIIYDWAESQNFASPFVQDKDKRSPVVATIDFNDEISASDVSKILRANGILDTESYRKLGRNQIRIATFPTTDPEDIEALTACIDYVVSAIS